MKRIILSVLVFWAVLGTAAVTWAYLTDYRQASNLIGTAENTVHIEETFDPPDDPKPGTVIPKAPRIVNDSGIGVYVRMLARFSDSDAEKLCEPLVIDSNWKYREDGYYYYEKELLPGEKTEPLFESVKIRADVDGDALIPFDILVYAESVQSHGFSPEEAWSHYTKGATA